MRLKVLAENVMATMKMLLLLFVALVYGKECYWNLRNPYCLFGTTTPYDTVRGDMRDIPLPGNCETVSVWWVVRHGNRHPAPQVVKVMQPVVALKEEILASYDAGNSELCAQDAENLRLWTWKTAIDESPNFLTKTGYEEMYNLGKRFAEKYHRLIKGTSDEFYFRPTNEQRTITSSTAFVHGLTDRIPLNVTLENPWTPDNVLRPFEKCDRYHKEVKGGRAQTEQEEGFYSSREFIEVRTGVQGRLGIVSILTADHIMGMYQLCRYFRPWTDSLRSPWCGVFSNRDLVVMEYIDDVSNYYKKGHGSWMNLQLGEAPLKDLYENLEAAVNGQGKKVIGYFTFDSLLEMMFSAMGLYFDGVPILGKIRDPSRRWRCSYFGAFASNMMAVLNRCGIDYRVQLYINEKETSVCPPEGCPWAEFQDKFHTYTQSNLSFCSTNQMAPFYRKT